MKGKCVQCGTEGAELNSVSLCQPCVLTAAEELIAEGYVERYVGDDGQAMVRFTEKGRAVSRLLSDEVKVEQ